ncbi:hypothetical protein G6F38_010122 [Rhizopus arrhizus]|nr:hypothetical protein G6F38_010122 [Rhizopus arrhizus]
MPLNKKKIKNSEEKENELPVPYQDFQNLEFTFYEIDSWIESSKLLLEQKTAELERVSPFLIVKPKKDECEEQNSNDQTLVKLNSSILNDMKWTLSFQPGDLLRIDTHITSVEQLIEAVHKIRPQGLVDIPEDDQELASTSTLSSTVYQAAEYWPYASLKNPQVFIEDYRHNQMNLDHYLKSIMPSPLNEILKVYWNCLQPQFASDWDSFWNRSSDPKLNQLCTDAALSRVFLHIKRHDRYLCPNAQELAGYYFDRARGELTEYFDDLSSCSLTEAIVDLALSCLICKRFPKAVIYTDLGYRKWIELGANHNQFRNDRWMRKRYLKIFMCLQFTDFLIGYHHGKSCIIDATELHVNCREIISLNNEFIKSMDPKQKEKFKKDAISEAYHVYLLEVSKIGNQITKLILSGASTKVLLMQEHALKQWCEELPAMFSWNQSRKDSKGLIKQPDLEKQCSLSLGIQYERQWINIHKGILQHPNSSHDQRASARQQCIKSAIKMVELGESYCACFDWCVFQYFICNIYQASTVFCLVAMEKTGEQELCRDMIFKVMRIAEKAGRQYEGLPDGISLTLCEFLKSQDLHIDTECACGTYLKDKAVLLSQQQDLQPPPQSADNASHDTAYELDDELKELKQMLFNITESDGLQ